MLTDHELEMIEEALGDNSRVRSVRELMRKIEWMKGRQRQWSKPCKYGEVELCEHGIPEGDYCQSCNKAYKAAMVDPENQ